MVRKQEETCVWGTENWKKRLKLCSSSREKLLYLYKLEKVSNKSWKGERYVRRQRKNKFLFKLTRIQEKWVKESIESEKIEKDRQHDRLTEYRTILTYLIKKISN